jgi:hypothetical protein
MFSDPGGESRKAAKYISNSRNQLCLAGFNMHQRSKAINFQFKDKLIRVEGFFPVVGNSDRPGVRRNRRGLPAQRRLRGLPTK